MKLHVFVLANGVAKTRDCRVHAVPAKSQAPRLSCMGACVFGVQHARPLWSSKRGPVSARQPRGQTYVRILGATKCPAFWPFGSTRPSLRDHNFAKVGELELDKRQARSNTGIPGNYHA